MPDSGLRLALQDTWRKHAGFPWLTPWPLLGRSYARAPCDRSRPMRTCTVWAQSVCRASPGLAGLACDWREADRGIRLGEKATGEGRAWPANPGGRAGRAFLQNRVNSGEPSGSEARALTDTYQAPRSLRGGWVRLPRAGRSHGGPWASRLKQAGPPRHPPWQCPVPAASVGRNPPGGHQPLSPRALDDHCLLPSIQPGATPHSLEPLVPMEVTVSKGTPSYESDV